MYPIIVIVIITITITIKVAELSLSSSSTMINTIICITMSPITSTILKVAEKEGQKFGRRIEVLEYSLQQLQVFTLMILKYVQP